MTTIWATILLLGILIFVHEFGHFIAAKLFRIRVERFSIGYPPRMIGKKIGETDYCLSWIPFGGYVKIAGMVDESLDKAQLEKPPEHWEFRSRPWYQKFLVILAGPMMNILLAYFVFAGAILYNGMGEVSSEPLIGGVVQGEPADRAGLKEGDRIVSIDGKSIKTWGDIADVVHNAPEKPLSVSWAREDSLYSATIVPVRTKIPSDGDIREVGLIGIDAVVTMRKASLFEALEFGGKNIYYWGKLVLVSIAKLISGRESIRSIAGPVLIAKMAGESARSGFETFIGFLAFLSLNLGILNLLPIPVLDGGHLVIIHIEGIIRKSISVKVKLLIQQIGMILIFALTIFVLYQDIIRVVKKE